MPAPPVLLLVFNRPDITSRLLDAVRVARPARLFVAADGPRPERPGDADLCRRTRALLAGIDWPCRLETLYRDTNLGLQAAVTTGISWFFEHVDSGAILEDDCLPAPDFLPFAAEVLARHAGEPRIMHVSGLNMRPAERFSPHSYFFAEVGHVWGWATWRRAWRLYDASMAAWPAMRRRFDVAAPPLRRVLGRKFASAHANRKRTWPRIWYYTMARHDGLAIIPSVNLIRNVGFGDDATHTRRRRHPLRLEATGRMAFPLDHPPDLAVNARYQRHLARYHAGSYARRASETMWSGIDMLRRGWRAARSRA